MQKVSRRQAPIVQLRGDFSSAENHDPGAHAEHLIDFGRYHDHPVAVFHEFLDKSIDLLLGAGRRPRESVHPAGAGAVPFRGRARERPFADFRRS